MTVLLLPEVNKEASFYVVELFRRASPRMGIFKVNGLITNEETEFREASMPLKPRTTYKLNQIESESKPDFQFMTANVANTLHDTLACVRTYALSILKGNKYKYFSSQPN